VAPLDEIAAFGIAHFNTFDQDRIPADVAVRFAGEGSEAPGFVERYVLDDIDAIGSAWPVEQIEKIRRKIFSSWWTVRALSTGKLLIIMARPVEKVQASFYR